MASITFTLDTSGAKKAIRDAWAEFRSQKFGYNYVKRPQVNVVEKNVKNRLLTTSMRNPQATPEGTGEHILKIIEAIKTTLLPYDSASSTWRVGTGKYEELETSNFLTSTGLITKLWQILEKGAYPHIIYPTNFPKLYFYWYRYGMWVEKDIVHHPGQRGRHYFLTIDDAIYESDKAVKDKIYEGLLKVINKYSYSTE